METQICPDRISYCRMEEGVTDFWETDRWSTDAVSVAKKHEAENHGREEKNKIRYGPHNDLWLWESFGPPRTCSFCGGIHPEDALKLMEQGWEIEGTGKGYKRYLSPPGYHAQMRAMLNHEQVTSVWHPTPPVKIYFSHWSKEQGDRFNKLLEKATY